MGMLANNLVFVYEEFDIGLACELFSS